LIDEEDKENDIKKELYVHEYKKHLFPMLLGLYAIPFITLTLQASLNLTFLRGRN
jgi:hypothetical protein